MSDSIRARFSDSLELVTHVPIPAGDIEADTLNIYVLADPYSPNLFYMGTVIEDNTVQFKNLTLNSEDDEEPTADKVLAESIVVIAGFASAIDQVSIEEWETQTETQLPYAVLEAGVVLAVLPENVTSGSYLLSIHYSGGGDS